MRIRTFTANAAREAIELVRAELGPQAIIIALDEAANGRGVIVRAAIDETLGSPGPAVSETPVQSPSLEQRLERLLLARLRGWSGGLTPQRT